MQSDGIRYVLCHLSGPGANMTKDFSVTITLRVSENVRELLRTVAKHDHRSMANMVEVLILKHAEAIGITVMRKRKPAKSAS